MKTKKKVVTPTLDRLMAEGKIHFDGRVYYGHASDGLEVHIGNADELEVVERYLTGRPNPTDW